MMDFPWNELIVKGNWMITLAQISAPFLVIGVIAAITYFKLWGYLYKEWFMSVDHKKNRFDVLNLCGINVRTWWY